jgi:hypothetical protein
MLAEADMGMTRAAMGDGSGDEQLLVRFYTHPKQNMTKTKEMGRPIFEDKEYIEIIQPGNKDSIVRRPASELDLQRFPEHYRKWKARQNDEDHIEGTLLEHWPAVTRSQVAELKYLNVFTVEQLANLADNHAQGMMGVNLLKKKATEYLDASKTQAAAEEIASLKVANEQLQKQMAALAAKMEDDTEEEEEAPAPRRRTRKSTPAAE